MIGMRIDAYGVRTYKNKAGRIFFIHQNSSGLKYTIKTKIEKFGDVCTVCHCGTLEVCKRLCENYEED